MEEKIRQVVESDDMDVIVGLAKLFESGGEGVTKDVARAKYLYERAAKGGDTVAMVNLALMLERGNDSVQRDVVRAMHLYERAAECGNATAMRHLGNLLKRGDPGIQKDAVRAKDLFERAAETGDVVAMFELAGLLRFGDHGVAKDVVRAKHFYERAVEGNHLLATHGLAVLLADGCHGIPKDVLRAKDLYEVAVEGGVTESMNNLAMLLENGKEGVVKDVKRAKGLYERAAEGGNVAAMFNLAVLIKRGDGGVMKDVTRAKHLFERAAADGHVSAMHKLAVLLEDGGDGVEKDVKRAKALYERAVEGGSLDAMFFLGHLLSKGGDGVEKDIAGAKSLYERAVERGNVHALNNLGLLLCEGDDGVVKDVKRAKALFERATEGGNIKAMYNLACLLEDGDASVAKDVARAVALYEQAAERGLVQAMRKLGLIYEQGDDGFAKDVVHAKVLYERAIERGDVPSMTYLAYLLEEGGDGVEKDFVRAKDLYERAVEGGDSTAMNNLGFRLTHGECGNKKDVKRAKLLLERAVDAGHFAAMKNLANLLRTGDDEVEMDVLRAKYLYERSVKGGNVKAMYHLAVLLEEGDDGVAKDPDRAMELYERAADKGHDDAKKAVTRLRKVGKTDVLAEAFVFALSNLNLLDEAFLLKCIHSDNVKAPWDLLAGHNLILLSIRAGVITIDSMRALSVHVRDHLYLPALTLVEESPTMINAICQHAKRLGIISGEEAGKGELEACADTKNDAKAVAEAFRVIADRLLKVEQREGVTDVCISQQEGRLTGLHEEAGRLALNEVTFEDFAQGMSQSLTELHGSIRDADHRMKYAGIARCLLKLISLMGFKSSSSERQGTEVLLDFLGQDLFGTGVGLNETPVAGLPFVDLSNCRLAHHFFSGMALAKLGFLKWAVVSHSICMSEFQSPQQLQCMLRDQIVSTKQGDRLSALVVNATSDLSAKESEPSGDKLPLSFGEEHPLDQKARKYYQYLTHADTSGSLSIQAAKREIKLVLMGCDGLSTETSDKLEDLFFSLADDEAEKVTEDVFVRMFSAVRREQENCKPMEQIVDECAIRFRDRAHPDTFLSIRMAARVLCNAHKEMVRRGVVRGALEMKQAAEDMQKADGNGSGTVKEDEFLAVVKDMLRGSVV